MIPVISESDMNSIIIRSIGLNTIRFYQCCKHLIMEILSFYAHFPFTRTNNLQVSGSEGMLRTVMFLANRHHHFFRKAYVDDGTTYIRRRPYNIEDELTFRSLSHTYDGLFAVEEPCADLCDVLAAVQPSQKSTSGCKPLKWIQLDPIARSICGGQLPLSALRVQKGSLVRLMIFFEMFTCHLPANTKHLVQIKILEEEFRTLRLRISQLRIEHLSYNDILDADSDRESFVGCTYHTKLIHFIDKWSRLVQNSANAKHSL